MKEKSGINPTDFGFSIVKLAAVAGALVWGIYHPFSANDRVVFLWLIAAFFVYNFAVYLSIFKLPDRASRIYLIEFFLDLTFLSIIVPMTGGMNSTFTLGYFLIAAAQSYYYGLAGSIWIALVSAATYLL
jgi:hypothetical protein